MSILEKFGFKKLETASVVVDRLPSYKTATYKKNSAELLRLYQAKPDRNTKEEHPNAEPGFLVRPEA